MQRDRVLGYGLIALGAGLAANSVLGPLLLGVIDYHLSGTLVNQGIGLDGFSLLLVTPLLIGAGVAVLRGSRAAALVAVAPALYLPYMFLQYIAGPEYTLYGGNNERFFLLHLALLSGGAYIGLRAWSAVPIDVLPAMSRRAERIAGTGVLVIALFIAFGMYVANGLIEALTNFGDFVQASGREEYRDNPHMYWTVVMLDLGILVPAALATGIALLRGGSEWARKAMYAVIGWLALVGPAVAAMGIAMLVNDDPTANAGKTAVFCVIAAVFVVFAARIYAPLFHRPTTDRTPRPSAHGRGRLAGV